MLHALENVGLCGLTDPEIAAITELGTNEARARRLDLVARDLVIKADAKRPGDAGRMVTAWRLQFPPERGISGCPCANCGHVFSVRSWHWIAMQCPKCRSDMRNPVFNRLPGRPTRSKAPATVELRVYVTPSEAERIKTMADQNGETVSTFLWKASNVQR